MGFLRGLKAKSFGCVVYSQMNDIETTKQCKTGTLGADESFSTFVPVEIKSRSESFRITGLDNCHGGIKVVVFLDHLGLK